MSRDLSSRGRAAAAVVLAAALAGSAGAQTAPRKPYEPPTHALPPRVQQHVDQAYLALNGAISDLALPSQLALVDPKAFPNPAATQPDGRFALMIDGKVQPQLPATKVFDQLYYLGVPFVSAWALVTRDGIIIIDSLNSPDEAERYIEGGLRSLGLDPAKIKYVVVTHGHPDHYGGAKYLQDKYHARVLMSALDWDFIAAAPARRGPAPAVPQRDMEVADGQTLSLGGTTITFYVSPGHTPGPLSTIFQVTRNGRPHVVSFFGGTGLQTLSRDPARGDFAKMRGSMQRFAKLSLDAGADVILSNHPFTDGAYQKVAAQRAGRPGSTQPWVAGRDAVLRFYVSAIEGLDAVEASYEEKKAN